MALSAAFFILWNHHVTAEWTIEWSLAAHHRLVFLMHIARRFERLPHAHQLTMKATILCTAHERDWHHFNSSRHIADRVMLRYFRASWSTTRYKSAMPPALNIRFHRSTHALSYFADFSESSVDSRENLAAFSNVIHQSHSRLLQL